MRQLFTQITAFHPLTEQAIKSLEDCITKIEVNKNDFLITEGKKCTHLYFLEHGALRGYYNLDGKEVTHWFAFENDFVTSFHGFITNEPCVENIQLLEHSTVWAIEKNKLEALYDQHPDLERLVRIVYEKYYIRLEERYVNAQFRTAIQLYDDLMKHMPHILQRVPLGHIASYLGLSQETLSRIRGKH